MSFFSCIDFGWGKKTKPEVFYVEGNVGVGKSECISYCAELLREKGKKVKVIVDEAWRWEEEGLFTRDTANDVRAFCAYGPLIDFLDRERFLKSEEAKAYDVVLIERHPSVVVDVFHDADEMVRALFEAVGSVTDVLAPPAHTLYVAGAPTVCFERIRRRNKTHEKLMDEDTLADLEKKLEDCFKKREVDGGKVHRIDSFGATSNHISTLMAEYVEKIIS